MGVKNASLKRTYFQCLNGLVWLCEYFTKFMCQISKNSMVNLIEYGMKENIFEKVFLEIVTLFSVFLLILNSFY